MGIKSERIYWAECDKCGWARENDDGGVVGHHTEQEARTVAQDDDIWTLDDGRMLCVECATQED